MTDNIHTLKSGGPENDGQDRALAGEPETWSMTIDRLSRSFASIVKANALAAILAWALIEHKFLQDWLRDLTHAEAFGVKIDRKAIDEATAALQKLAETQRDFGLDKAIGEEAIRRSARVAPAIVRAKILWVDDKPTNNELERSILRSLRIDITVALSTAEAMRALRRSPYDLIISNVWRPNDPMIQLKRCQVHYFDYPDELIRKKYEAPGGAGLTGFNEDQNQHGPAGFGMIEELAPEQGEMVPRVLFYAGKNAEIVRSLCGDKITNRADILLQSVVSILEEQRWDRILVRDWNAIRTAILL
jgi:CheY-like chemotaxis protein